ncbi:MAG: threonylcarbamoyl-AMP synthase [Bacteroidia bacterium]|nr:threonylcarbamoyl-AMP synthase [Bacteroidia bacterium]
MIGHDIQEAADKLRQGLTVGIPTETVYGLAANALNESAVVSIFKIKDRPFFDPLIIHVKDLETAKRYVRSFPPKALLLAEKFWPGPLTLLLPKESIIPDIVTSGSDLVAIRVPSHPLTLSLLELLDFPLAAPSANPFGYISPTQAEHVEKQLGDKVSYILDGGSSLIGLESTIVNCSEDGLSIVRLGGLSVDEIEKVIGTKLEKQLTQNSNPLSPGQLDKHYSPKSKFVLSENISESILKYRDKKIAILTFGEEHYDRGIYELNLSKTGDLEEAARNLFHYMRLLDIYAPDIIISKKVSPHGLGLAINDRLVRASSQ